MVAAAVVRRATGVVADAAVDAARAQGAADVAVDAVRAQDAADAIQPLLVARGIQPLLVARLRQLVE